jgi:hypothetical protein
MWLLNTGPFVLINSFELLVKPAFLPPHTRLKPLRGMVYYSLLDLKTSLKYQTVRQPEPWVKWTSIANHDCKDLGWDRLEAI